ncbi:MAG: SIR2 family protein [Candidatus Aminicenantes bacterium]|nr:MAG: SIR2 family protein [Candidatus Aminicenantes bacterium]
MFTHSHQNSLLKIHGGLRDIHSIVLASTQYASIYGHPAGFNINAPLPVFFKRVFTNCPLLFIGCSLAHDRTIMIMESLKAMRPHFAIMKRPGKKHEQVKLNRRLSNLGITPIWILEFAQIQEILQQLAKSEEMAERLEQLYTFSWCDRRESDGQRAYELHQLVRELVRGRFQNRYQERFILFVFFSLIVF